MDRPTATLIGILQDRVSQLRESGDLVEALHAANATVDKCQQLLSPDLETVDSFAMALEIRGDLRRELGQAREACEDYRQALDQLDDRPDCLAQLGRIEAALGAAYDMRDRSEDAARHWGKAIIYFERHDPPLLLDIASISNNLGVLHKAEGNLDLAETEFLRALEIMYTHLGREHEETASVASNLGALYQAAGYFDQSREMHMIALETRQALFGEEHADTAQSHNNLALALLSTGDCAWARRHFEKALTGFEALGSDYFEDLDAVANNYCEFLKSQGEEQMSRLIAQRVRDLIGSVSVA